MDGRRGEQTIAFRLFCRRVSLCMWMFRFWYFFSDGESRIGEANRIQDDLPIFCQKFAPQSVPFVTEDDAYRVS